MRERVMFDFSLMTGATLPPTEMKQRVERALGCPLRDGEFQGGIPAYVADVLGMRIYLYETRAAGDTPAYSLHGNVENSGFFHSPDEAPVEPMPHNLDEGVIDLLEVYDAGRWHVPSEADYEADRAFTSGYLDDIAGVGPVRPD